MTKRVLAALAAECLSMVLHVWWLSLTRFPLGSGYTYTCTRSRDGSPKLARTADISHHGNLASSGRSSYVNTRPVGHDTCISGQKPFKTEFCFGGKSRPPSCAPALLNSVREKGEKQISEWGVSCITGQGHGRKLEWSLSDDKSP
jgi:hypothetical protein